MKSTASFPLAACFILLHLSLVPSGQAAVSQCLNCFAIGGQNNADADACRAGNPANIPKVACVAPSNHGCSVTLRKMGGMTTLTRSCCSNSGSDRCQDDLHQEFGGKELHADSCLTDNCNTFSSAVMTKMFPCTILLLVLLFTSV
jgi:hypothetical protein